MRLGRRRVELLDGRSSELGGSGLEHIDVVRDHWSPPITVLDITTWNEEERRTVHAELVRARETIVRVRATERTQLRRGILDLNTVPVEVGPLMFHPQVTAVSDAGEYVEARVLLREAWL